VEQFRIVSGTFASPRGVYVYAYEQDISGATTDEGFFFCPSQTHDASFTAVADVAAYRGHATCTSAL